MSKPYVRLDKNDAAVLMVDHQTGLLSLVRDIDPDKFKNNVLALGDLAKYFGLPTILTTSFENGPNGPLVPELKEQFLMLPILPDLAILTHGITKISLKLLKQRARNN
jgi:nicotinamidase-related amidase